MKYARCWRAYCPNGPHSTFNPNIRKLLPMCIILRSTKILLEQHHKLKRKPDILHFVLISKQCPGAELPLVIKSELLDETENGLQCDCVWCRLPNSTMTNKYRCVHFCTFHWEALSTVETWPWNKLEQPRCTLSKLAPFHTKTCMFLVIMTDTLSGNRKWSVLHFSSYERDWINFEQF